MKVKTTSVVNVPNLRFPGFDEEWLEKKLSEIANFSKGKGISKSDIANDGLLECVRYGQLYTDYSEVIDEIVSKTNIDKNNLVLSESGDVIIPASGETQIDIATASCVLKSGVALGGDLNIIKTSINGVFLSYYLNNTKKFDIARLSQGISVVHLYASQLKTLKLNVPPQEEQQKIAKFLTVIDERISTQIEIIEDYEEIKKGMMQQLFSQQLRFKDNNGANFPDWEEKKLGEVCKVITGKTPKTNDASLWDGTIKFITPTDIIEDEKYQKRTTRTVVSTPKLKILPIGSIIYTCIASIGKMAITTELSITNQQINSLIPNKVLNDEIIYYSLLYLTPKIKSTQANTTLPIINKSEFSNLKFLIPSSKKEQTKISNFLSSIDERLEKEKQLLETYKQQKKYLLQNMFV